MLNHADNYPIRQTVQVLLGSLAILLAIGCDSNESAECRRLSEDTYSNSAPLVDNALVSIALFELKQEIRTYEAGSCEIPAEGISETSLVIRNLTSCELSFMYRLSVFESTGWTVEGTSFIRQGAADDQGVIQSDSGIRLDHTQIIVIGWDEEQTSCE